MTDGNKEYQQNDRRSAMASAHDVAAYILQKTGEITTMKLQKLIYYAQVWNLVWDEAPLFHEKIEAWANGPIVRDLYNIHRGQFQVASWDHGDISNLESEEILNLDIVIKFYGHRHSQWLSDLTHGEDPWRLARTGLSTGERGNVEITHASMHEYYSALQSRHQSN